VTAEEIGVVVLGTVAVALVLLGGRSPGSYDYTHYWGKKIMATLKELSDKADNLQATVDVVQQRVADAIALLEQIVADGGTETERQAVLDKLTAAEADLSGTLAPPEEEV
jgi:hypothetical protein